ncbi:TetR/AcrR family transcriptional regulator [Haloechinothrix sp. LS1_15]|uniref:TetR/AcrR family transcriptional regulator n=1 Tax=Haloechinothrix sp. LS1_15 TaxID=2652248 RepID=UPI0029466036|nr:TetR/AcrR family transcriptional regulator [Haloechinothrix sp. LS1_15]MDV6012579.1 TetR/AcrR family transcriptional regulator [Haloechinothrix sp. LS1_15]
MSAAERSSDPERLVRLLWEPRGRPARGPKPGLTLDRIVRAAIEITDAKGFDALSMRGVAQRLGVGTSTLYSYVPGKAELYALMLDTVAGWSSHPHTLPGDWRARYAAWAREDWADFRQHPWVLRLRAEVTLPGPNMMAWLDSALRVLDGTGLTEHEKLATVGAVDGFVRRAAQDAVEAPQGGQGDSSGPVTDVVAVLAGWVDPARYPRVVRAIEEGVDLASDARFEFGLQRLLDGIEAFIVARAASSPAPPHRDP